MEFLVKPEPVTLEGKRVRLVLGYLRKLLQCQTTL